ncbi:hypothetical protein RE9431_49400 (plasmid) [Prescottella equi]|nr:hypothetical protein RE9414_49630 [Prescottella equi]BCN66485.1 hypothetical protein RE9431_49400 [Prescottella equi]BCN71386.1 hypothetical protein RE943_48590 [Prescottella equi]BCN76324.1 hypothetical protein RE0327_49230 [Prescottella equi]BCN81342.1 hypothetical protein RE0346_50020 [Prescottella equi]
MAVEGEDVEQVEDHRNVGPERGGGPQHVHPALEPAERGPALRVEGDDLAVEDRVAAVEDISERVDQLGKAAVMSLPFRLNRRLEPELT